MENAGEHLVGQYLRFVKKCGFVDYNIQTTTKQGEIDVVGIHSADKVVYICEVATHLETGLRYVKDGKPDNVNRFKAKFEKNITYAKDNFKDFKHVYMLWTPIIKIPKKNTTHNQLRDLEEIRTFFQNNIKLTLK